MASSNKDLHKVGSRFSFNVGKQWVFIKDGLDDFRDGLPPPSSQDFIDNVGSSLDTRLLKDTSFVYFIQIKLNILQYLIFN